MHAAAGALAPHLQRPALIAGKSTVPVGTARSLLTGLRAAAPAGDGVDLAWNPEFLREGHAVQDSLTPDRFVFGVSSPSAERLLRRVYARPLARAFRRSSWIWRQPSWSRCRPMPSRRTVIDARCALDARLWQAAGWSVHVLSRP